MSNYLTFNLKTIYLDSVKADVDNKEVEVVMDVTEQTDLKKGIEK